MGVYVKTPNGLERIDNNTEVTKESVVDALGYTPANEANMPNITEDDSGMFYVTDPNGNIIFKVDKEGIHSTEMTLPSGKASELIEAVAKTLSEHVENKTVHITAEERTKWNNNPDLSALEEHTSNKENPHSVTKSHVGLDQVDNTSDVNKPVSTAQQTAMDNLQKAMSEQIVSESKEWHIVDSEGNIVATIDANGVSSVDFLLNGKSIKTFFDSGTPGLEYGNTSTTGEVDTDIGAGEIACVGVGSSSTTDIDIASHYYSYIVSQVGAYGGTIGRDFRSSNITSVRIPSTVVHIRDYAFANCEELKYVTISEHGQELVINSNAFQYCTSLGSINLPNRVTDIGALAFVGCTSLISIILPGSLKFGNYNHGIFQSSGLQRIYFEDGFELITDTMCRLCANLTYVSIPKSVTKIYLSAFQECKSLKELTYDGTITEWNSIEKIGLNAYSDDYTLTVKCTDGDVTLNTADYD